MHQHENGRRNHIAEEEALRINLDVDNSDEENARVNVQDAELRRLRRINEMSQMSLVIRRVREQREPREPEPGPRLQLPNGRGADQAIAHPAPRMFDPDIPRLFRKRWYRPLLPFESVLDIFNASPHLEQVQIVTTADEKDTLRQDMGEFFDIQCQDPPEVND